MNLKPKEPQPLQDHTPHVVWLGAVILLAYPRQLSRDVVHNLLHTYNEGKTHSLNQKPKRTTRLSRVNTRQSSHRRQG
jgi:hypothetical protein